jgi:hypothetical protein
LSVLTSEGQQEFVLNVTTLEQVDTLGHHLGCPATPALGVDTLARRHRRR